MNNKQKSIRNILCSALSQIVSIGFGLVLPRLFVVSYGSEVNGLLTSLSNFLICLNLFEAGIGTATLQALYKPVAEKDWRGINGVMTASKEYYARTGKAYFAALLALALVYPLLVQSDLDYLTVFGAVFFSGIGNVVTFFVQGRYNLLLRADGRNYIIMNLTVMVTVLVNLSKVLLIYLGANIVLILGVAFGIQCLYAAGIVIYVRRNFKELDDTVPPNREAVGQKNFVLAHQIGTLVFNNTDVIILTMFCGLKVVSVYSMFKMISSHLDSILNILLDGCNFVLGQTYQVDRESYKRMIDAMESVYSGLAYGFYAVALFLYLPFMRIYTAGVTDINYVDPVLAALFVAAGLLSHSRMPMNRTIDYAGHFKQTLSRSITETVINITASLVGVYFWGIYGVLLGTVAALLYRTNDIILYANTRCLGRKPWKTYGIYLVNVLVLLLSVPLFDRIFGGIAMDSFPMLVLVAVGVTALALPLFLGAQLLCFPQARQLLRELLNRKINS